VEGAGIRTLRGHEEVDALEHIEEEFIAAILDALTPPPDLSRHLACDLARLFLRLSSRGVQ
jgi:hypothetical protein